MSNKSFRKGILYESIKRLIDIVLSVIILIIFFPVLLFVAIIIKLESSGPILADTPPRVGRDGRTFKMYKFRSMVKNAHHLLRDDPRFAQLYHEYKKSSYKLKADPRITRFGKFIRKYSLDELPQFVNVLFGDMSVVGPRAYYPDELENQQKNYPHTKNAVRIVLSVKPGITGFWQVNGRSEINFDKRIEMDAVYVKKRSILYDCWLIFKTPWAMLSGKGV
ncbi:MAG TPA: sugar transferase [Patescibacteria group bacterium]|nr:sugar transferase [Patescibacteria group bacterium]